MKIFKNNNTSTHIAKFEYLEEEDTDYESFIPWKNSFEGNNFFEWLRSKFEDYEEYQIQNDKNIIIFQNESTFAFRVNTEVINLCPSILRNYWKDEILDLGYVLKNSEVEYKEKETIERYYLKPRLKYKIEKDQRFGNITLELFKSGANAKFIMLKCTWYKDQNFNTAHHYEGLLKALTL